MIGDMKNNGGNVEKNISAILIFLATCGEADAFTELIVAKSPMMKSVIRGIVHDEYDVEEAYQNALTKAWTHITTLRDPALFDTWFYSIVKNESVQLLRGAFRAKRRCVAFVQEYENTFREFDSDVIPHAFLEVEERRRILRETLKHIKPEYRKVLYYYYYEGLSYHEIAELMGVKQGTVGSYLLRGKRDLYELISQMLGEEDD